MPSSQFQGGLRSAFASQAASPIARRVLALVLGLSAALASSSAVAAAPPTPVLVKGPYLQNLDTGSVEVRFEVDPPSAAKVELRAAGAPKSTIVDDPVVSVFHSVRLEALEPQTRYEYTVRAGSAAEPGSFTTAPSSTPPFTFLLYGDNRSDDAAHASVVAAMLKVDADFLVHTGDFVADAGKPEHWRNFFSIERGLLRNRCAFTCIGNHEFLDGSGEIYVKLFGRPSEAPQPQTTLSPGHLAQPYRTFRWSNARFFLLNAFDRWVSSEERAWLDDELRKADKEPGIAWRFAVLHHGPWSAGVHGGNKHLHEGRVVELLREHKIDFIMAGHDHLYERGEAEGFRYVVSGGGGAPLYPVGHKLPSTRKIESAYHFLVVSVGAERVRLNVHRADGSSIETCDFGHTPGWGCDPTAAPSTPAAPAVPAPSVPSTPKSSSCGCRAAPSSTAPLALFFPLIALALRRVRRARDRS